MKGDVVGSLGAYVTQQLRKKILLKFLCLFKLFYLKASTTKKETTSFKHFSMYFFIKVILYINKGGSS